MKTATIILSAALVGAGLLVLGIVWAHGYLRGRRRR